MKTRSRLACVSAAAALAAFMVTNRMAAASDLTWDANGTDAPLGSDIGGGAWDTTSPNWVLGDTTTGTNVTWNNATPDSAIFGNASNAFVGGVTPHDVELNTAITVQNISINLASDGSTYNISDFNGGSLTLAGNITKTAGNGNPQFLLPTNGLTLTAGDHTIGAADTPGDGAPEIAFNANIAGPGNIIIDNGASNPAWGSIAFNGTNTYTGTTSINKGRLEVSANGGLGNGSVIINNAGTLSIGGSSLAVTSPVTLNNPITITRNTYSGGDYGLYGAAILINNNGSSLTHTIAGPLVLDTTEGRIKTNTNNLVISSNVTKGPDVATAMLTLDGDFAGFVTLAGDNTGIASGGIKIMGGVEVNVSSDANLAGATAPLTMAGGTLHPVGGWMTTFGSHVLNNSTFSGGVDVDQNQTFTIDQPLGDANNAVGALGKRGLGTLNLNSVINLRGGQTWFDSGVVNVNNNVTLDSLHLRSPVVNIGNGGSVTVVGGPGGWNSIGADSTGTNGGPDIATINLTGTGSFVQTSGDDFNISDNANTQGTINISDNAVFTTGGITWLAKSNGAVATLNQSGGTVTINRSGNFGFVIADARGGRTPTGHYNLSGGTFTSKGEVYVGEGGNGATATWTQTGGTATINNWFVIGREGSSGTFDMSGGTLNHSGGNMSLGDSNAGGQTNTINVHGTAVINDTSGELWVGNNGGAISVMNVADTASVTVNTWLAVGRAGGTGTLNVSGGTVTQQGSNWFTIGSNGNGTVNIIGGTVNALQAFIGETGNGNTGTINISGGNVTLAQNSIFANGGNTNGNLNLNGGTLTAFGFQANNGGGTGKGTFTFNGGTLQASADNGAFIGAKIAGVVSTGGARVNTNGHAVSINSSLAHDVSLTGADGGLTKSGAGVLTLGGSNSYTGRTVLNGSGSVVLASSAFSPVLSGGGATVNSSSLVFNYGTGTSPASTVVPLLKTSHADNNFRDSAQQFSTSNAADATHGLGYVDDATANLTVAYTWYGDANLDGKVTADDYALLDRGYAQYQSGKIAAGTATWSQGDFNYDGAINSADYLLTDTSYGKSTGQLPESLLADRQAEFGSAYVAALTAAVPEPASLALLGLALPVLGRRRRTL